MSLATDLRRTLTLAWPIALAHGGQVMLGVIDSVMVGHYGTLPLAELSVAKAVSLVPWLVAIGFLSGVLVRTAQAVGGGRMEAAGATWQAGVALGLTAGMASGAIVFLFGGPFLAASGVEPDLLPGAARFCELRALGMPASLILIVSSGFLEGLARPRVVMALAVAGLPVNVLLNWLLIWGNWGFPELGSAGAALGTTITEWLMAGAYLVLLLRLVPDRAALGLTRFAGGLWRRVVDLARFGVPFGLASGLEMGAFATLSVLAGGLGTLQAAAFEVLWNVNVAAFALIVGFASATSVRVGQALGARDGRGLMRAGWLGMALAGGTIAVAGIVIASFPAEIARLITNDPAVIAGAVPLLLLFALALLGDSVQFTAMFGLRAANDVWGGAALQITGLWLVMVPVAVVASGPLGWGLSGLGLGWLCGTTVAALLMMLRFRWLSRRLAREFAAVPAVA